MVRLNSPARIVRTDKHTEEPTAGEQTLDETSTVAVQSAPITADAVVDEPVAIAPVEDEKEDASLAESSEAGPEEGTKAEAVKSESAAVSEPKQDTEEIDGIKVMRFRRKKKAKGA